MLLMWESSAAPLLYPTLRHTSQQHRNTLTQHDSLWQSWVSIQRSRCYVKNPCEFTSGDLRGRQGGFVIVNFTMTHRHSNDKNLMESYLEIMSHESEWAREWPKCPLSCHRIQTDFAHVPNIRAYLMHSITNDHQTNVLNHISKYGIRHICFFSDKCYGMLEKYPVLAHTWNI